VKGYGQSKKKKEDVGQDSVPVGYETVIDMYPLDFEDASEWIQNIHGY